MLAQDVVDYIFQIAPNPEWAKENIYEFGSPDAEVTGIGVAWWITTDMLEDFTGKRLNLGITHERTIYDLPDWYHWGTPPKTNELHVNQHFARLAELHGVTIHRFHSNLDLADWGMPAALLHALGWQDYSCDWSRGVPLVTHPPVTLRELVAEVKDRLALPFVRYDGDLDRVVSRISLPWGGLCQWWTGAATTAPLGYDVIIGGDIIDGVVRFAREQGYAVIDAFHHSTEMPAMEVLAAKLRDRFPEVPVHYYPNPMPWSIA